MCGYNISIIFLVLQRGVDLMNILKDIFSIIVFQLYILTNQKKHLPNRKLLFEEQVFSLNEQTQRNFFIC